MINDWLKIALQKNILMRAIKVALVVGSILMLINHGDVILSNGLQIKEFIKITLTYLVPYCVSTYSSTETVCATENMPSINQLMWDFLKQKSAELAHCSKTVFNLFIIRLQHIKIINKILNELH
ncbi:MAG: nitrate/nitrite transporter NrtS [Methylomonas sp.]|nr:nitrate/nitrite transporter NrtS [Methylomonas sp.]